MSTLLDVSDLMLDPDFVSPIQLIHRTTRIDKFGENKIIEKSCPTVASVQPTPGRDLMRLPEDVRIKDVRTFYLKADLVSDGNGKYPYVISYRGDRYQIINVKPWNQWGAGWNEGIAVREVPGK